jgi:hypothetical protein
MTDEILRITKHAFADDSIEVYRYGDTVTIEIDEPWAGSTETGFGQTCSIGLSLEEAKKLAEFILNVCSK